MFSLGFEGLLFFFSRVYETSDDQKDIDSHKFYNSNEVQNIFGYVILPIFISLMNKILRIASICQCCQNQITFLRECTEKIGCICLSCLGCFCWIIGLFGIIFVYSTGLNKGVGHQFWSHWFKGIFVWKVLAFPFITILIITILIIY